MSSLIDGLVGGVSASESLRRDTAAYVDQGGMLGLLGYVFVALERDDALAANVGSQLTHLFVASSLHDDAIDEVPSTGRKRFLNERITVGDIALTRVADRLDELPGDTEAVTGTVREIGRGQLAEESVALDGVVGNPSTAALQRLDARGSVWGRLLAALVETTGGHEAEQLARIETIATNLVFVYTIFDDVADLREDVENGVVNAPLLLLADERTRADDLTHNPDAAAETMVDSTVPERLGALVERRETRLDDACLAFHENGGYSTATVVEAVDRGLEWYCESVCTTPLEETVSTEFRADVRRQLSEDRETKQQFIESAVGASPLPNAAFPEVDVLIEELPVERLVPVFVRLAHVDTLTSERLPTSLDEALSTLERST